MKINKKGLVFKLLLVVFIIIVILVLFVKLSRAETASINNSINVTLKVNSSDIIVNVSNSIYQFANSPSIVEIQQGQLIYFDVNYSIINNTIFQNGSVFVNYSVNCPSEIDLSNATKEEFFNHYITQLSAKIEESGNKISQDVLFKLEPTKVQLDDCKNAAFNASLKEQEAYTQRDKIAADNIALGSVLENERSEKKTLQIVALSFVALIVISVSVYLGIWERKGRLF